MTVSSINNINSGKKYMANTNTALGNYQIFSTLRATINDILLDTINYLSKRFNQSRSVFTAASPFGQLLIVVENLSQLIFYYIEDSITELNINEASRLTSIYSLAALSGHNPSRSMSAVGQISLAINDGASDVNAEFVIIPNLTKIVCKNNGLSYILDLPQDEIKFSLKGKDDDLKLNIRQGVIESQTVTSKGRSLESFSIGSPQNFFIDQFFVNVYVNGEKWERYESMLDIPRGANGYIARTGISTGLDIYFGNSTYGKIVPPGSEIVVEYLINEGPRGNIRTNDPGTVRFSFVDTGFTIFGKEVDLTNAVNVTVTQAPFFGVNPESSELTRLIAPKQSKSFALVNPDHYEVILRKLNMFSLINVYLDSEDERVLDMFMVPDMRKKFKNIQDYYGADLDNFILSDYQKSELLKYIEKSGSKLISTDVKIVDPVISNYVINASVIVYDDVPTELIKNDINIAISEYFINNKRRERIPKSDLIKLLEEIKGVDSVAITIVSENNEKAKKLNPDAQLVGVDSFNDIIIKENELPIIRGGFSDRHGNIYDTGLSDDSLGCVNINIKDIILRPMTKNI